MNAMNVTESVKQSLEGVARPEGWALMGPASRWQWVRDTLGVDALAAVALLQAAGEWELEAGQTWRGEGRGNHVAVPKRWSRERLAAKRGGYWWERD